MFNDALRLDIEVIGLIRVFEDQILEIGNIIDGELHKTSLYYKERLIPQRRIDDGCQVIILSKEPVSKEIENVVVGEKRESTEEENEILRSLLIVKFGYKNRL